MRNPDGEGGWYARCRSEMGRIYAFSILLPLLLTVPLNAQADREPIDVDALGPQVGERVPDFSLVDQNGVVQTLDGIMGPRGALILFHRSADW